MLIENRDVNVEMRTVWAWGRFMADTPNTRLRAKGIRSNQILGLITVDRIKVEPGSCSR
jgi:hypothetical protein